MKSWIVGAFIIFTCFLGRAQSESLFVGPPEAVLSFKQWKLNQLVQAQDKAARLSHKLIELKKYTKPNELEIENLVEQMENASQHTEFVMALKIEDYVEIYVSTLPNKNGTLTSVAAGLTDGEVAELLKIIIQNRQSTNTSAAPQNTLFQSNTSSSKTAFAL
jgi:hypothetical protein